MWPGLVGVGLGPVDVGRGGMWGRDFSPGLSDGTPELKFRLHTDLFRLHTDLFRLHTDLFRLHTDLFRLHADLGQPPRTGGGMPA